MNTLQTRQQIQPNVEVSAAGQLEQVNPFWNKSLSPSPISDQYNIPSERTTQRAPVVHREERTVGMRYAYGRIWHRQPLKGVGHGKQIGIAVNNAAYQQYFFGRIVDMGFNDALYQAGYPGFNLGLSFKVGQIEKADGGGGVVGMRMRPQPRFGNRVQRLFKSTGRPQEGQPKPKAGG